SAPLSPGAAWERLPSAAPTPYLAAQTGAAQLGRPIEPWRDSLKLMMLVWGAIALAAFATPTSTDPLAFSWASIIHAQGTAKLPPLVWAAVGVLSIVGAVMPLPALPRGAFAGLLGLAGFFVPFAVLEFPQWQPLLLLAGALVTVTGLLVRNEYTVSVVPRVL